MNDGCPQVPSCMLLFRDWFRSTVQACCATRTLSYTFFITVLVEATKFKRSVHLCCLVFKLCLLRWKVLHLFVRFCVQRLVTHCTTAWNLLCPRSRREGGNKRCICPSVRPSVCPSVAYIANNSRTQRPSVPKFARQVPHAANICFFSQCRHVPCYSGLAVTFVTLVTLILFSLIDWLIDWLIDVRRWLSTGLFTDGSSTVPTDRQTDRRTSDLSSEAYYVIGTSGLAETSFSIALGRVGFMV